MAGIDPSDDGFIVDAALLAEAFELAPRDVQSLMRRGDITSRCEIGIDEDAGRARLTFRYNDATVRFVVDEAGNVLKRTRISGGIKPGAEAR